MHARAHVHTQVTRHNDTPFSLLQVCAEFGLPLLQSYLTRHVISHLTLETVCQTLVGASSLMKTSRDDSLKLALKQIAQESNAYVISHARAIFQGRGYLDLPKDTFIGIISSNEVGVYTGKAPSGGRVPRESPLVWISCIHDGI